LTIKTLTQNIPKWGKFRTIPIPKILDNEESWRAGIPGPPAFLI
jgi:hypothetical protein